MHTANFGARRRCLLAALVEVTLTLDFFSSNAMRLIPGQLRLSNRSTADPDSRHTLELAPSSSAVHFLKPRPRSSRPVRRRRRSRSAFWFIIAVLRGRRKTEHSLDEGPVGGTAVLGTPTPAPAPPLPPAHHLHRTSL